jgi:hypothetical protein
MDKIQQPKFQKYDIHQLLYYCWMLANSNSSFNKDVCAYIVDYIVVLTKLRHMYFSLLKEANVFGGYVHSESGQILAFPLESYSGCRGQHGYNWCRFKLNYSELRILFVTIKDMNNFYKSIENRYRIASTKYYSPNHIDITMVVCGNNNTRYMIFVWLTGLETIKNYEHMTIKDIDIKPSVTNETTLYSYLVMSESFNKEPAKKIVCTTLINL